MAQHKKTTKEEKEADIKALRERKERDAKLNYRYSPCPFCGKAIRWRLPTGVSDTEENIKKYEPKHCREDECAKSFQAKRTEELKAGESNK
jgi:hypothetical protein